MYSNNLDRVIIRRIENERDLQAVYLIEQTSFSDPYSLDLLNILANLHYETFFLAEFNNKVIGYIISIIRKNYLGHIISIAVDPLYRRTGIASKLMEKIEDHLRRKGIFVLRLEVKVSNLSARKFYLKLGFKEGYIIPRYYRDGTPAVVMFKLLRQEK